MLAGILATTDQMDARTRRAGATQLVALCGAAAVALAGCGSVTSVGDLPPAAEPASSPPLRERPAGRVVDVGNLPEGVVADSVTGIVAVGLREPDRLALVDGKSGRVLRRVALPGGPRHLGLARPGGSVLVPAERADALVRVSLPNGARRTTPTGSFPHDAAAAAGGRVFVTDERGNTLSALDDTIQARFPVATQPGGVAATDGGGKVAVVSVRERVLELYDANTLERLGRTPAGAGPTHAVGGAEGRVYAVDTTGGALLVFETRPELKLTRRVTLLGSPYGLAVDPVRGRLWVTLTARNELVELAAGPRPRPLRRFPTARQPNTVAVDPGSGRVYVTGKADGVLQIVNPPPLRRRAR
jgi:hypothetical protein